MALGKYTRIDGRKSSNYWSTVAVVAFASLCLVGIWMMTTSSPSTVTPAETIEVPQEKQKPKAKEDVAQETPGDLPKDATNGDGYVNKNDGQGPQHESQADDTKRNEAETEGSKGEETKAESGSREGKVESDESDKKNEENPNKTADDEKKDEVVKRKPDKKSEKSSDKDNGQWKEQDSLEVYPSGAQSELLNETKTQNGAFSTQATESKNQKEIQRSSEEPKKQEDFAWKLCNTTAGPDYIPCLDNWNAIHHLKTTKHYEHRERHCPTEPPTCLVSVPQGYRPPVEWPTSREKIWYYNVPHAKLAEIKGHQNWVKVSGEFLTFPGGGTQFKHGALHYIDFIQEMLPDVAWGKRSRVVLDVGCGVASFGGFLFDRDVLTMSFAPKDEHEAQVQFALERGIPAISAVMGTQRLPFPATVFDVVHCARCRVPWHIEGGKLLLELNRVLRPEGFFIWSATPVYLKLQEDVEIWKAMSELTKQMCWKLVKKQRDAVNKVGIAIFQKPSSNECYEQRTRSEPPFCPPSDDPSAAWKVPLRTCMHKIPTGKLERGSQWPEQWSARLNKVPYWLTSSQVGVYGTPAPEDFTKDYKHWKHVVSQSYINRMGISWSNVRNVMDMRAVYGGFAAALRDMKVWVMNVISVDAPDTLPVIYERGLFGIYHDWCESFSTYPRSYDLLHADHLFSKIKKRCNIPGLVVEVDRILRPEGKIIIRDTKEIITELETMFRSMHWEIRMTYSKDREGLLCAQKTIWRPKSVETLEYAIMCPGDRLSKKRGIC